MARMSERCTRESRCGAGRCGATVGSLMIDSAGARLHGAGNNYFTGQCSRCNTGLLLLTARHVKLFDELFHSNLQRTAMGTV